MIIREIEGEGESEREKNAVGKVIDIKNRISLNTKSKRKKRINLFLWKKKNRKYQQKKK